MSKRRRQAAASSAPPPPSAAERAATDGSPSAARTSGSPASATPRGGPPPSALSRRTTLLLALAIIVPVLIAYVPAIRAGFIWDDDDYLTENPLLLTSDGLTKIWFSPAESPQYYPLVFTMFWVEYRLWGLHPMPFHLVNVLLHAANALLLWRILRRISVPAAWWIAAVFALHPVHVESVAWVTERKNVLSGLLYLVAAWCWLQFEDDRRAGRGALRTTWHRRSIAAYVGSLLAKTVTASLPAALVLVRLWRRRRLDAPTWTRLAPMFVIGFVLGLFTASQEFSGAPVKGPEFDIPFATRLVIATRAPIFYASKLLWPTHLAFFYPRWQIDPHQLGEWWALPVVLALAAAVLIAWWRRDVRGPAVALAFFVGTLFPALGFFDVYPFRYSFVADHFQYLASIGVIALVVGGLAWMGSRLGLAALMPVARAVGAVVLAVLALLTFRQSQVYDTREKVWVETLRENPGAWNVYVELGAIHANRGEHEKALELFEKGAAANPNQPEPPYDAGNELAILAAAERKQAAAVQASQPDEAARLLKSAADREARAEAAYVKALTLDPTHYKAHFNYGLLLRKLGRNEDAVAQYRASIEAMPTYSRGYHALGSALEDMGRRDESLAAYREAARLDPSNAATKRAIERLGGAAPTPPAP